VKWNLYALSSCRNAQVLQTKHHLPGSSCEATQHNLKVTLVLTHMYVVISAYTVIDEYTCSEYHTNMIMYMTINYSESTDRQYTHTINPPS